MAGSDDDPLFGGGGGLDDLGPRRKKPGSSNSAAGFGSNPTPSPSPAGPDLFDLQSAPPDSGPTLELESVPPPSRPRVAAADLARGDEHDRPTAPAEEHAAAGTFSSRTTLPGTFDLLPPPPSEGLPTVEVAAVAEYGPAPGFLGAIPYALHVWGRRKELVSALADARRHRKSAELTVEETLASLGRAIVENTSNLGGAVEALTEDLDGAQAAVQLVGAEQEASARAEVDTEERKRVLSRDLDALRRELDPVRDRETKLTTQLEVRQQDLARARAKFKRAEIEQRNAEHDPALVPESAALALADRDRHEQEVAVADRAVRDVAEQLATIKRDLAEKLGRAAQLEDDLRSVDREKEQTRRAQLESGGQAAQNARRALALLARRAVAAKVATSADAEMTQRVGRADADLERRRRRERIVHAAIDAYDKPTLYQGLGLLGGAALIVLVFVLFVIGRAIF